MMGNQAPSQFYIGLAQKEKKRKCTRNRDAANYYFKDTEFIIFYARERKTNTQKKLSMMSILVYLLFLWSYRKQFTV